jgi:AhpD family alkylhydroperoxidase
MKKMKDKHMEPRIDYQKADPKAMKGMMEMEKYLRNSELDETIYELVKMRASQINGCAFCLDMHSKDARAAGETEQRLYGLDAWREAPYYSDKERAALEWTEAVTLISENHVPDELYNSVREYFDEQELVALTMAVVAINGWNRLAIPFRTVPGEYEPGQYE